MIEGIHVYLRSMEMADVPFKVAWVNDVEVNKTLVFSDYPTSKIATEQWLMKAAVDPSRKDFVVCNKADDIPVGFAGLKNIDIRNLKAESYLGVGAKEFWGKGYGYDIKRAILIYAFDYLMLNKVYSYHLTDNKPIININMKLGGKKEGVLREDGLVNGVLKDRVLMSVLRNEFIR